MLSKSGVSGHLCLVLTLRGNMFTIVCDFSCAVFIYRGNYLLFLVCYFYHGSMLNFAKQFFCISSKGSYDFYLSFYNVVCHIDWFPYVEASLYTRDKSYFVMVYDPPKIFLTFIYFWETERDRALVGERQRERDTQSLKQAPGSELSAQLFRAQCGAWTHEPWDHDLSRSQTLTWLSHPGAPVYDVSNVLLDLVFAIILLRIFASIYQRYWPVVFLQYIFLALVSG